MHFLVIEDDVTIRDLLAEILDMLNAGHQFTFLDGSDAVQQLLESTGEAASESLPGAIFIDVRTSNQQGADIARQIRSHPILSKVHTVLILPSGLSRDELDTLTWRAGADRFIFSARQGVKGLNRIVEEMMLTAARLDSS